MSDDLEVGQIVRIKGDGYIRKILDIRHGDALTTGADGNTGYIDLNKLEAVSQEELDEYKNAIENSQQK